MKKFKDILDQIPDDALISVSTTQLVDARHYKEYNLFLGLKCELYNAFLEKEVIEFYKANNDLLMQKIYYVLLKGYK